MKICRILYTCSPYSFGGADIHAEKISRAMDDYGNQTVVITVNPKRGETIESGGKTKIYRFYPFNISTIHRIGKESPIRQGIWTLLDIYSYHSYIKIKNILQLEKPDIVHIHTPIGLTLAAVSATKSVGLPLVYTLHDYFLLCRRMALFHGSGKICTDKNVNLLCKAYRAFTKKIINDKVDVVIASSRFVLDMHRRSGFFNNSRAVVLSHGIDLKGFDNYAAKAVSDRKKDCFDILYVGGLTHHKGVHILICAFKQIKNKNVKLHIVGGGVYESGLRRLAGDDDRIVFYGKLPNENVQQFYKMADVSVVPSIWYDVRPNVIPEAFRAGIPVIASDIGGIPELIKDKHNGFLFTPGNIEQLRLILEDIMKGPEILKALGRNARESVKEYEMSGYIQRLTKIYEEAVETNKICKCQNTRI